MSSPPARSEDPAPDVRPALAACRLCAGRFAATATRHDPRPVVWFAPGARLMIASQAPGLRVHEAGTPFWDRSGVRLRDWMGVSEDEFYDRSRIAIVPMAFCFPGYDAAGGDLPPPPVCAATWRAQVLAMLPQVRLTLLVGGSAQRWHLPGRAGVTETVRRWREVPPAAQGEVIPLPHPSWRNTGWLHRNPWFDADLVPHLRARVRKVLDD